MTSHIQRLGIIPYKKKSGEQRLPNWTTVDGGSQHFCFWGNILRDETGGQRILMRFRDSENNHMDYPLPFRFMRRMGMGTKINSGYPNYELPDKPWHTVRFSPHEVDLLSLADCPQWIKDKCMYQGAEDVFGQQPIFRFRNEDRLYYLPAMEFIRKCYIANALCCDDVIYPGRMETAISYKEQKGERLTLHLLRRYRRAFITKGTAQFLARWYTCMTFRASFNSVANETILLPQRASHPLRFEPPRISDIKLTCIQDNHQKRYWIERIIDIKNIPITASEVVIYQGTKKCSFKVR
ncbi:hypothetical protein EOPP23_14945 [Endozoicomonas sp. OPT23]|uniref:hypothetical protein n=1 Tax=Endozoicomonas sp. OPT23 TaxID=2072845 RepID=UPI00129A3C31|nr:hypothetical protein [Endozoicomonas sp. OPT23]MRI34285.1 hypothetical protein [Endozoicomonas sp. OPT23]